MYKSCMVVILEIIEYETRLGRHLFSKMEKWYGGSLKKAFKWKCIIYVNLSYDNSSLFKSEMMDALTCLSYNLCKSLQSHQIDRWYLKTIKTLYNQSHMPLKEHFK